MEESAAAVAEVEVSTVGSEWICRLARFPSRKDSNPFLLFSLSSLLFSSLLPPGASRSRCRCRCHSYDISSRRSFCLKVCAQICGIVSLNNSNNNNRCLTLFCRLIGCLGRTRTPPPPTERRRRSRKLEIEMLLLLCESRASQCQQPTTMIMMMLPLSLLSPSPPPLLPPPKSGNGNANASRRLSRTRRCSGGSPLAR